MRFDVEGIEFSYSSDPTISGVSMSVGDGDVVSILGPNGVGKTTFLKCLNGILHPGLGTAVIDGRDLVGMSARETAREIGYVAQRGEVSRITVFESVLLGRRPHIVADTTQADLRLTGRVIEMMGLQSLSSRYVDELSGGQYQLVQIARAFAQHTKVILFDEPTSSLDPNNQYHVMGLIRNVVKANGMAAVMVVHDLNLAIRFSDRFVLMKGGRVFAAGGKEVITPENIREVYGMDVYVEEIHGITVVVPKESDSSEVMRDGIREDGGFSEQA